MDSAIPLFLAFLVALTVLAIFGQRYARQRREALAEVARRRGLAFHADHVHSGSDGTFFERLLSGADIPGPYEQFSRFRRGSNRRAYNTLTGRADFAGHACEVWAGDFRYQTSSGSGKNRRKTTHRFSYMLVAVPFEACNTTIRPENFLDRVGEFVGIDDIDFESDAFSRAFHVTGDDKRFAYDLCDPQMMQFLLETRPPAFSLTDRDAAGRHWLLVAGGRRWEPEAFERQFEWISRFIDHWPRHLRADRAFEPVRKGAE